MSSKTPDINLYFTRYLQGYETNIEVVNRLSTSKTAKTDLATLINHITTTEHWKENPKLVSLHQIAKITRKSNFNAPNSAHSERDPSKAGSFLCLTPPALGAVAGFLPNFQTLFQMGSCCKEANQQIKEAIAQNPQLLSRYLSKLLECKNETAIMLFLRTCSQSQYAITPLTLSVRTLWPRLEICLHEIQKKFPTIAKVEIAKKDISDQEFVTCLAAFPNLQALDLSGCTALSAAILHKAKYPVTVEHLYLSGTQLDDQGLQEICKNGQNLKVIDIRHCAALTLPGIFTVQLPSTIEQYITGKNDLSEVEQQQLLRLLESAPDNTYLLTHTAVIIIQQAKSNRWEQVQANLEKAHKACPRYVDALADLGKIHVCRGLKNRALGAKPFQIASHWLSKAVEIGMSDVQSLISLIIAKIELHEYKMALTLLDRIRKIDSDCPAINPLAGRIYMAGGEGIERDFKKAEELLRNTRGPGLTPSIDEKFELAIIYHEGGYGIERNVIEAKRLMKELLDSSANPAADIMFIPEMTVMGAKLGKYLLEDASFARSYKTKVNALFKVLLASDPMNSELKEVILSCAL